MSITIKPTMVALAVSAFGAAFSTAALADDPKCYYESRSGDTNNIECATYHSEISNTRAFVETVVKRGKWTKRSLQPVILDVRSTTEYKAAHPEHSYNVPYPYIYQYCNDVGAAGPADDRHPDGACKSGGARIAQTDEDFVDYVMKVVPNKDTPIYTMCRTGVRSVGAANRLAEAGYTNVRNMWEGFVGINLKAPFYVRDANGDPVIPLQTVDKQVDLNHDDAINDLDKNGWLYHQALPYDTRLLPKLIYKPRADTYSWD